MATGDAPLGRVRRWLRDDWRGQRIALWGALVAALTLIAILLYYSVTPAVVLDPDTPAYLRVARVIAQQGKLVDSSRLPGYPLLIDLTRLFAGSQTLAALGVVQAALFLVATLEIYALGCVLLRRAWLAFIPAALVGVNVYILSFVQPLLTEGLTLALVTTLALAVVWWEAAPSPRRLWLVALAMGAVFLTRPEWAYLPIPLLVAMALLAWRRGDRRALRQTLAHGAGAVVALYTVVGAYVLANGALNGYYGFSDIQAFNLLGKALQYHLVGNAPTRYASIDQAMRSYLARGVNNPWQIEREYAPFQRDHFRLMSGYATAMMQRHPVAFAVGCWGTLVRSLSSTEPFHPLPQAASGALLALGALARMILSAMWPFLLIAPTWWALWARGQGDEAARRRAARMSLLALLVAYDLFMTTVGGYIYYARLHTPFDPLLMLVVVGSALLVVERCVRWRRVRSEVTHG